MRNEVNNWQYVRFFILTYKAKHNVLAFLHERTDEQLFLQDRQSA